jgi:hypothetical protein
MKLIQGELFRNIPYTDYFNSHEADFSDIKFGKIITHNSDFSTSQVLELNNNKEIFENSDYIWFAQNVDTEHPRIFSLPIGLENSEWFPEINKIQTMLDICDNFDGIKTYACVAEFNPRTHPKRLEVFQYYNQMAWCLTNPTINGLSFESYIENMARSHFCVCPRGNGIDTHRIWEAMYCGCIPIVERCLNIEFYEHHLPIFVVDDLTKVTYKTLFEAWDNITKEHQDWGMLYMEYWINSIDMHV